MHKAGIPEALRQRLRRGTAIPALPLALDASRRFDERRERALLRYYIDAGVGGIAVGVHSTQFEIRDPDVGLFEPVLRVASQAIDQWCEKRNRLILKIAGLCGPASQARAEADYAVAQGYHAGLLSLAALKNASEDELVAHCARIAEQIPVIGFYLQPSVGGRVLSYRFWRRFAEIENVLAIKIAPFNRYMTFDVVRAVCEAGRAGDILLYTGNDDSIIVDLLTEYQIQTDRGPQRVRIAGGLLGHWGFWTRRSVEILDEVVALRESEEGIPPALLTLAAEITDVNAAVFDAANGFAGCIPGIHEMLRRVGLLEGTWCLNSREALSPGQGAEIDRVWKAYPHLSDAEFVRGNLPLWLEGA